MALPRMRPNNSYAIGQLQDSATNVAVRVIHVNDTTLTETPYQELLSKREETRLSEQKTYDNDFVADGKSETVLIDESADSLTEEFRMPTESELRIAKLTNIPRRGFCVSADIEKITADSYRYLYDPDEFTPPDI